MRTVARRCPAATMPWGPSSSRSQHSNHCKRSPSTSPRVLTREQKQEAGFHAAYLSGFALSASRLAEPDIGLTTFSEVVEAARACCDAVTLPVVGDGDTGFGGALNVRRTIHGFARAGLAGISIEDQTYPKRCSYAVGVQCVSRQEAIERVRAALKARDELCASEGRDLVVIARTDAARAGAATREEAVEEAIARCVAFEALGADVVYAEGLESESEMLALNAAVSARASSRRRMMQ